MALSLPAPGGPAARRPRQLLALASVLRLAPRRVIGRVLAAMPTAAVQRPRARINPMGDLQQQLDQGLNHSIVDSLRTGNMMLDMLICMLVPVLIRFLLVGDYFSIFKDTLTPFAWLFTSRRFVRIIEYTDGGNTRMRYNPVLEDVNSTIENTDRNNILQKAIKLYMCENYDIDDADMETNLVSTKKIKLDQKSDMYGTRQVFGGNYTQLLSFQVHRLPQKGKWTLVDTEKKIWFMQQVNEQQVGTDNTPQLQTKTVVHIGGASAKAVNDWIEAAFEFYKEKRKSEQDTSRFFYVAVPGESKSSSNPNQGQAAGKTMFKQYLLSDHKTFHSLFFPEKDSLLQLIDHFLQKKGKFAIEGFPDKLGLLLDGPPGTGKTSLIKALAHYCQRHVVSVNLSKIKTNQELMDLLFDLVFPVQGGELPAKLQFKDIIFVMEDVDAASKVVYARAGSKKVAKKKKKSKQTKAVPNGEAPALSSDGGKASCEEEKPAAVKKKPSEEAASKAAAAEKAPKGDGKEKEPEAGKDDAKEAGRTPSGRAPPPAMPQLLRMISARSSLEEDEEVKEEAKDPKEEEEEEEEDEEEEEEEKGDKGTSETFVKELVGALMCGNDGKDSGDEKSKGFGPWKSKFNYEGEDDLNLAGLLNVLDGVVDSPGRIVVMTTNHPDKLDPALIRPGRINKRIHLGFVAGNSVCSMAEHYMQVVLTPADRQRLERACAERSITPAQVEQCCAESEDLAALVSHLEDLS